jgi:phage-related protein
LQIVDPKPGNEEDLEKDFQLALPRAYRLLQLTTEFLDKKEEEREAFWRTPEGKKKFEAMRAQDFLANAGGSVCERGFWQS